MPKKSFSDFINMGLIRNHHGRKRDPANTGGIHIHPILLPVPFPHFSVNIETDGINIEIRAEREKIFFHSFSSLDDSFIWDGHNDQ